MDDGGAGGQRVRRGPGRRRDEDAVAHGFGEEASVDEDLDVREVRGRAAVEGDFVEGEEGEGMGEGGAGGARVETHVQPGTEEDARGPGGTEGVPVDGGPGVGGGGRG